jgi:beta-glucosidase
LPIKKSQKNIAVIGPLANDKNSTLGTWRVSSDDNHGVSLLEGLRAYNGNYTFAGGVKFSVGEETFSAPVRIDTSDKSGLSEAVELAKKSELVIMMLGEHGYQSGEARSRSELGFPGLQQELLEAVYAVNKNIVLVVASGRPLILTWAAEHIPSILQTWQLGSQSGHAIADVIFGQYNPSGKLPMCFPRSIGQIPISYQRFSTGRPNASTTVFWSHYNDEKNEPLYPFGFGLSYTQFEYSELTINAKNKASIKVSLAVKNVGKVAGEEVVQLYIRDKVASLVRPTRELKAFKKIHLRAGKKQKLTFELTPQELGFYNQKGNFIVESGEFDIFVGGSSDAALSASFTL